MDLREITITGRLGRDSEVKGYGQEGKQLVSFAVGTTCGFGDKAKTIWYKCTSFKNNDVKLSQYLLKGQPVVVIGEHGKDEWTDQQSGLVKTADTINVSKIVLLQKGEPAQAQPSYQQQQAQPQNPPSYNQYQQQAQQPAAGGWGGPPPAQQGQRQGPAAQPQGSWGDPGDETIPF